MNWHFIHLLASFKFQFHTELFGRMDTKRGPKRWIKLDVIELYNEIRLCAVYQGYTCVRIVQEHPDDLTERGMSGNETHWCMTDQNLKIPAFHANLVTLLTEHDNEAPSKLMVSFSGCKLGHVVVGDDDVTYDII